MKGPIVVRVGITNRAKLAAVRRGLDPFVRLLHPTLYGEGRP
ncbi:MAG: hypothetical protein V3V67_01935 [Myxococcota bacterium]